MKFKSWFLSIGLVAMFVIMTLGACNKRMFEKTTVHPFEIIAYYSGDGKDLGKYRFDQLTQVIYSFCHLKGNKLAVDNSDDSLAIRNLVALKKQFPKLKILLSLGGWCGCEHCSTVFSSAGGRTEFSESVLALMKTYQTDGLDLDWEYPAISGCPDHPFKTADRPNFTALVLELRRVLGPGYELSFAAGGFKSFFDQSVEWDKVMPALNRVNLMSYDLVSGFSTVTGHHTPLYATAKQEASVDAGVQYLKKLSVPAHKIVIGAAFYGRVWEQVQDVNNGLYQNGKFKSFVHYSRFKERLSDKNGFVFYRDSVAHAPFAYSASLKEYATFDDPISLREKTQYARREKLGGIMFWQLTGDPSGELLDAIYNSGKGY